MKALSLSSKSSSRARVALIASDDDNWRELMSLAMSVRFNSRISGCAIINLFPYRLDLRGNPRVALTELFQFCHHSFIVLDLFDDGFEISSRKVHSSQ